MGAYLHKRRAEASTEAAARRPAASGGGRILRLGIPNIKCVDTKYMNNVNFSVYSLCHRYLTNLEYIYSMLRGL